jgi:glycosyltransferase involved in cell wall biosynthesis
MRNADPKPLVSVHMPAHNGEKTIRTALMSLFAQSHDNWEAIVVDDGSRDRTREVVESFQDPRIKLICLPSNQGRAYARQVALDESSGDFVAYLDCDDFYHPEKLERQLDYFKNNPDSHYCGCGFGSLDVDGSLRRVRSKRSIGSRTFKIGDPFPFAPVASMMRIRAAQSASYKTHMRLGEDIDYFLRALNGMRYGAISDVLYFYGEYESVTLKKILATYVYVLKAAPSYANLDLLYATALIPKTIAKIAVMSTAGLVTPIDRLIDRRGQEPCVLDRKMHQQALEALDQHFLVS